MERFALVVLRVDLPAHGLKAGTRGVILDVSTHPPGVEVEWIDDQGQTTNLFGAAPEQVEMEADGPGTSDRAEVRRQGREPLGRPYFPPSPPSNQPGNSAGGDCFQKCANSRAYPCAAARAVVATLYSLRPRGVHEE